MNGSGDTSLTQCPHCDTVFQVSDEQLQVAQGRVRCGRCQGVFDALAHPYEQHGGEAASPEPYEPREPHVDTKTWESDDADDTPYIIASRDADPWTPPDDEAGGDADVAMESVSVVVAQESVDVAVSDPAPDTSAQVVVTEAVKTAAENVPDAAAGVNLAETLPRIDIVDVLRDQLDEPPPPAPPQTARNIAWSLLAFVLMLGLGGQYLYFARADLAQYDPLRPWLERACTYLGCALPLRHAPEQIELLSRDVVTHPRVRNALLINATFVNRANYVQVYPVLQISLSNESGAVVAMRRFQPEEYLAPGARIATGMAPGAPVRVVLEVAEPKHTATSFQFEFL